MDVKQKETYQKWKSLVNMSASEIEKFYNSEEGKKAGLKPSEAKAEGIDYGRESARWILKMKKTPVKDWTPAMWKWANKQISFISRMSGNKGGLYDEKGEKTRKHLSLLIWGHNPSKFKEGGEVNKGTKMDKPKNNLALYTRLKGEKQFKASDFKGNQVDRLVNAPLVPANKFDEFLAAVKSTAEQNKDVDFRIKEFGTNKIWFDSQLSKGTEVELEHKDTIEEIASGDLTTEEAAKKIALDHIKEDPTYYNKLEQVEKTEEKIQFNPSTIDELKKSLSLAKSKGISESAIYDIQRNYFSDIVSNDPTKLGEFLLAIDGLTKKERFNFQMELNDKYGNTEAIDRFSDNLEKNGYNIYDLLPTEFKKQTKIKRIDFTPSPESEGLSKITDLFVGDDGLRPVMRGVYFDKENNLISATNAHILLVIAQKPDVEKSSICQMGSNLKSEIKSLTKSLSAEEAIKNIDEKTNPDGCYEIEGRFPDYIRVIPTDYSEIFDFNANHLMNYADTMSKHLTNTTTRQMLIGYRSEENPDIVIGVNAVFLSIVLKGLQMLGHDTLDFCHNGMPNKALVFVPKGQSRKITTKRIETDLAICMPVMIRDQKDYEPIYDLTDNTIKTVAQFFGREVKQEEVAPEPVVDVAPIEVSDPIEPVEEVAIPEPINEPVILVASEAQEIKETIEGLKILLGLAKTKKEKKEIQNEIDGLNILLEMPETFGLGGQISIEETTFRNSPAYIETVESLKQTDMYDPSLSDAEVYQYHKEFVNPKFTDAPEYFEQGGNV